MEERESIKNTIGNFFLFEITKEKDLGIIVTPPHTHTHTN